LKQRSEDFIPVIIHLMAVIDQENIQGIFIQMESTSCRQLACFDKNSFVKMFKKERPYQRSQTGDYLSQMLFCKHVKRFRAFPLSV